MSDGKGRRKRVSFDQDKDKQITLPVKDLRNYFWTEADLELIDKHASEQKDTLALLEANHNERKKKENKPQDKVEKQNRKKEEALKEPQANKKSQVLVVIPERNNDTNKGNQNNKEKPKSTTKQNKKPSYRKEETSDEDVFDKNFIKIDLSGEKDEFLRKIASTNEKLLVDMHESIIEKAAKEIKAEDEKRQSPKKGYSKEKNSPTSAKKNRLKGKSYTEEYLEGDINRPDKLEGDIDFVQKDFIEFADSEGHIQFIEGKPKNAFVKFKSLLKIHDTLALDKDIKFTKKSLESLKKDNVDVTKKPQIVRRSKKTAVENLKPQSDSTRSAVAGTKKKTAKPPAYKGEVDLKIRERANGATIQNNPFILKDKMEKM